MKPAKTTMCMLLAAALGSAATATTLWELEKRDPLYQLTKGANARALLPNRACRPYTIPPQPIDVKPWETSLNYKEQIYDAAITARGQAFYLKERIDGQPIAYTTQAAQSLYHKAISRINTLDANGEPTPRKDITTILHHSMDESFGTRFQVLPDGTPVIDYNRALAILDTVVKNEQHEYNSKEFQGM